MRRWKLLLEIKRSMSPVMKKRALLATDCSKVQFQTSTLPLEPRKKAIGLNFSFSADLIPLVKDLACD